MSESYDKYSDEELMEEVKEYYPHILDQLPKCHTFLALPPKSCIVLTVQKTPMQTYTDPCTYALQSDMRQLKEMIASDLSQYMLEMMPSLNDCVDWVCDRFALDATDELIDFVIDCHDEFFGN